MQPAQDFGPRMTGGTGQSYYTAVEAKLTDAVLNGGLPATSYIMGRAGEGLRRSLEDYYGVDNGTLLATTMEGGRGLAELIHETTPEGVFPPDFSLLKIDLPEGWPMHPAPADGVFITTMDIPAIYITWITDIKWQG